MSLHLPAQTHRSFGGFREHGPSQSKVLMCLLLVSRLHLPATTHGSFGAFANIALVSPYALSR